MDKFRSRRRRMRAPLSRLKARLLQHRAAIFRPRCGPSHCRSAFDDIGQTIDRSEAGFDSHRHQIADVVALITLGHGDETDRLAVAAVEREGDADLLAIVAAELEAARTLAAVCRGGGRRDVRPVHAKHLADGFHRAPSWARTVSAAVSPP